VFSLQKSKKFSYGVNIRLFMSYICDILQYKLSACMIPTIANPDSPLLRVLLERVLRTECLALEGLRLQAKVHNGLLGGDVEQLVQTAEKRAYQRAEVLLEQLLAAIAPTISSIPTDDLR
jgi:hypothetical protein